MPEAQIFISYRRDDAAGYARAVYDELARHFGAERVFIDVDDIGAGQSFAEVIERAVGGSEVLLVLIGQRWLGARDDGSSRLAEPGDFVALEVAAGLAKGMRVIPLLLDGATMPTAAQLPAPLRALAGRNALELGNTRFAADMERLVQALREALGERAKTTAGAGTPVASIAAPASSPNGLRAAAIGVALLVAAAAALWWTRSPSRDVIAPTSVAPAAATASSSARANVNGEWRAAVDYDWPNAHYGERFVLAGEGSELHGSASFLGVGRGVLEGDVGADGVRFSTRTRETAGSGADVETVHRYRGRLVGDELRFVMQSEGGSSAHGPVEFTARRAGPASGPR